MDLWQQKLTQSLRTREELSAYFEQSFAEVHYPVLIPLDLAQKIKEKGLDSPLGKQFLPQNAENDSHGMSDPIGDHRHSPTQALVHRYPSRALLFPTNRCPVICRYCFRKNELYQEHDPLFSPKLNDALEYLEAHPEIQEVILSGGDPLLLSDSKLSQLFENLSRIKHIFYIRFHTRFLAILPERFTPEFIDKLVLLKKRFARVNLVIHTNHSDEWDHSNLKVLRQLIQSGVEVRTQTVLLNGVNNCSDSLYELFSLLISQGATPYYLHHPDQVQGASHFRLSLKEGRKIYAKLRARLPGWALPQYIIDIPGGEGKVSAFNPESYEFSGSMISLNGDLKNFEE